jgi:hypothetical protein
MPKRKNMTTYHARDDAALTNGTFIRKSKWGLYEYTLGDGIGYRAHMPGGLKEYSAQEARAFISKLIL